MLMHLDSRVRGNDGAHKKNDRLRRAQPIDLFDCLLSGKRAKRLPRYTPSFRIEHVPDTASVTCPMNPVTDTSA
ncbi:MAG: hypothetical protein DHS20C16_04380 [Phycisphaerae bacterium]|nr:MAG: hypothetical protein DHS20C16_04380 [Phycisphaerae bacterium]